MKFLASMSPNWNISLFHYRNHGDDHGRILVGMQVPPADRPEFDRFLADARLPLLGGDAAPCLPAVPGRELALEAPAWTALRQTPLSEWHVCAIRAIRYPIRVILSQPQHARFP